MWWRHFSLSNTCWFDIKMQMNLLGTNQGNEGWTPKQSGSIKWQKQQRTLGWPHHRGPHARWAFWGWCTAGPPSQHKQRLRSLPPTNFLWTKVPPYFVNSPSWRRRRCSQSRRCSHQAPASACPIWVKDRIQISHQIRQFSNTYLAQPLPQTCQPANKILKTYTVGPTGLKLHPLYSNTLVIQVRPYIPSILHVARFIPGWSLWSWFLPGWILWSWPTWPACRLPSPLPHLCRPERFGGEHWHCQFPDKSVPLWEVYNVEHCHNKFPCQCHCEE